MKERILKLLLGQAVLKKNVAHLDRELAAVGMTSVELIGNIQQLHGHGFVRPHVQQHLFDDFAFFVHADVVVSDGGLNTQSVRF